MPDTYLYFLAIAAALVTVVSTLNNSTPTIGTTLEYTIIDDATSTNIGITTTSNSSKDVENLNIVSTTTKETPILSTDVRWECPNITGKGIECSCDFPHTLRCIGDRTALETIGKHLRHSRPGMISLLDVTLSGISTLPANFLEDVALHGLVISTGELRRVNENAFTALARPLQAIGLPNNLLDTVPNFALSKLIGLERLDLSHNKLMTLGSYAFQNLTNVTYLDLSDNLLSQLSPKAFNYLPNLRCLKMKGNRLSVSALQALRGLRNLEELDLSTNVLKGPLDSILLSAMPKLRSLNLSENQLKNVQNDTLMDLKNLSTLILSHNQIDVLADHAFRHLTTLTHLDLSYNEIVAVSSQSLAHLDRLRYLDLTHNFLRSLTADLVAPPNLEYLRLDDNDITMVTGDLIAKTSKLKLKSLSLSDNPLNCDCTLMEFAKWLSSSNLEEEDKHSAVCATPPALENGVLTQVSPENLLCGDPSPSVMTRLPLAAAQLTLNELHYDEATAGGYMLWRVEPCSERYTCDTLIVYESIDEKEVQIASSPIQCDSRHMINPCSLPVNIPTSLRLLPGHNYRYCVVLLVPTSYDDVSLGLGCSDIIQLEESLHIVPDQPRDQKVQISKFSEPEISSLHVNVSADGYLKVDVVMAEPTKPNCEVDLDIFAADTGRIHRQRLNCSAGATELAGLIPGRYRVCASVERSSNDVSHKRAREGHARCVEVQTFRQNGELLLLLLAVILCAFIIVVFCVGKTLLNRTQKEVLQPQCFMPAQEVEITHKAHYIKLHATTKV